MAHIEHITYTHTTGPPGRYTFTVTGTDFGDTTGAVTIGNVVDGDYSGDLGSETIDSWQNTLIVFHLPDYATSPSEGLSSGDARIGITAASAQTLDITVS
jgi:hypothetical protein